MTKRESLEVEFPSIVDPMVRLWFSSVFRGIRAKVIQTGRRVLSIYGVRVIGEW